MRISPTLLLGGVIVALAVSLITLWGKGNLEIIGFGAKGISYTVIGVIALLCILVVTAMRHSHK